MTDRQRVRGLVLVNGMVKYESNPSLIICHPSSAFANEAQSAIRVCEQDTKRKCCRRRGDGSEVEINVALVPSEVDFPLRGLGSISATAPRQLPATMRGKNGGGWAR